MEALDAAAGPRFTPGSNLPGERGASWCFVLPSLELGRIVCLGAPTRDTLITLARLRAEVVVCAPRRKLKRLRSPARGLSGISLLETTAGEPVPVEQRSADLVLLARRPDGRLQREIERLLRADGTVYAEYRSFGLGRRKDQLQPLRELGRTQLLWLGPAAGDVRVAAPLEDERTIAYLEKRFLAWRIFRRRLFRAPLRVLEREPLVNRVARRRALLVQRTPSAAPAGPPRYLRTIAARAGVDLAGCRWGLAAPGRYGSQKLLVFVFDGAGDVPAYVAKITRDAKHNPRLENEWRALNLLREQGIGDDGTVPKPLFLDSHASLAVLGETAIDGVPFLKRTEASPECLYARAAVDWLLELGIRTAHRAPLGAPRLTEVLGGLVDRFREIYQVERDHLAFLGHQADVLAEAGPTLPFVFQHGDPGPWNIVVTADGRLAFLDWEAADRRGMPLWDLLHFLRSYGLAVSRAAGTRDPLRSFADHYLDDSPLNDVLVGATARFCARTGLGPDLVEPLFYLCWMHRALKEAATLPPGRFGSGRYVNILRLALDGRDSPGLGRLFTAAGGLRERPEDAAPHTDAWSGR
jgi:hypothetical protein